MSAGLLGWLWSRIDAGEALALLQRASVWPLVLAAALGPLQVVGMAERWRRATAQLGLQLERREAILEYALSVLLNQVLPGGVAGDVVRVWRQRAPERPVGPVLRAAVAERVMGLGVHVVVTLAGLAVWGLVHPGVPRPVGAVVVALVLGVVLASSLGSRDMRVATLAPAVVGGQLAISAALTASFLGAFALCGHALGQPLGWATITVVPVVLLAMIVPLSVGGWGLREATAMAVLPALGWTPEEALAVSTAYGLTVLAGALPGALVPLTGRGAPG